MKSDKELTEYLTLQEVSQMLKVHPNTLRTWDKNGTLQAVRIGAKRIRRYRKNDVENFVNNSTSK